MRLKLSLEVRPKLIRLIFRTTKNGRNNKLSSIWTKELIILIRSMQRGQNMSIRTMMLNCIFKLQSSLFQKIWMISLESDAWLSVWETFTLDLSYWSGIEKLIIKSSLEEKIYMMFMTLVWQTSVCLWLKTWVSINFGEMQNKWEWLRKFHLMWRSGNALIHSWKTFQV